MDQLTRPSSGTQSADVDALTELALDLRWSWHHGADELWALLAPDLWARTHNPWVVLQTVSPRRLQELLARPEHRTRVQALLDQKRRYMAATAWFQEHHPGAPLTGVAYFSMEFALSEALPIYSGGLGNVAGDQLEAASDLGIPVVGIGLLYAQGYFRQVIGSDGTQEELYPYNDPGQLPITPVRDESGEWLRLELRFPGYRLWLRPWQVQVGRLKLLLLDSNDPANAPALRGVTSELYGGGAEMRLRQEIILGIGGWRLLRALKLAPEVCHLNEGHAALAVLERARAFMEGSGQPFDVALTVTRAGNLFTTHTSVPAGFDRFPPALVQQYLSRYAEDELGIEPRQLLALGRQHPDDPAEPFNMAYLGIRGSAHVNGVSRLHGSVSRRLFQCLFPGWPERDVPVGYVTNGVHTPSWDSAEADALWTRACTPERWRGTMETVERDIRCVSDAELWGLRIAARRALVDYVRDRMAQQFESMGAPAAQVQAMRTCFDPAVLTLAFARRFAPYKRPTLLLHDPDRLLRILSDPNRPVQLIVAGKAHPADEAGQAMIREWVQFTRRPEAQRHVIFVPDYDLFLAERLVQGVDLWVNTPRRPWEACGTSGMKVLVNGGLNVSELDGWWAEAYAPDVGWALGDGREHGDDPAWDAAEAEALYALLEREIVPEFYTRDAHGIPTAWVAKMRESMARLTPRFSANRAVREYTETYYLPAAGQYRRRAARGGLGSEVHTWQQSLRQHWHEAHFGAVHVDTEEARHAFCVEVHLGALPPDAVRVELYAGGIDGQEAVSLPMERWRQLEGLPDGYEYRATAPAARGAKEYRARLVPHHPDAAIPLEASEIRWQD